MSYNAEAVAGLGVAPGAYFSYVHDEDVSIIDLRIPILLNYKLNINEFGIGAFLGPQVNIGLADGDVYGDDGVLKRFDLALAFGVQASWEKYSFELGNSLGLLNRLKDAPDDCSVKTNAFFAGLGYTF